ncbi:MAG: hypothetical protein DWQ19_11470 [Crenarchaeota archaeon]|nr:MAG: hypothetical protein DWQ19_11470 [Thermoproteota archaeon]
MLITLIILLLVAASMAILSMFVSNMFLIGIGWIFSVSLIGIISIVLAWLVEVVYTWLRKN